MKVVLVRPPINRFRPDFLGSQGPLNLWYLATALSQAGITADVLDFESVPFSEDTLVDYLAASKPDILGLSAFTCTVSNAAHVATVAKRHFPELTTVLGGVHVSTLPRESVLEFTSMDYIYVGEGEVHFPDFCRKLIQGEISPSERIRIPGVCYRTPDGEVVINPPALVNDLDALAFPDRTFDFTVGSGVKGLKTRREVKAAEILTSRGCPFRCTFCAVEIIHSGPNNSSLNLRGEVLPQDNMALAVRQRTPENVLREVKMLKEEYGVEHLDIIDSTFTVNRKKAIPIVEGIGRLGLTYNCNAIINTVNYDILKAMVETGCQKISYGIETGSPKILELINKRIRLEGILERIEATRKAGMPVIECSYIIGVHPEETEDDMRMTEDLMHRIDADITVLSIGIPFPGTAMFKQFKDADLLELGDDWDAFVFYGGRPPVRTLTVSNERLLFLQKQIMRRYYLSPRRVARQVRKIKSWRQFASSFKAAMDLVGVRAGAG